MRLYCFPIRVWPAPLPHILPQRHAASGYLIRSPVWTLFWTTLWPSGRPDGAAPSHWHCLMKGETPSSAEVKEEEEERRAVISRLEEKRRRREREGRTARRVKKSSPVCWITWRREPATCCISGLRRTRRRPMSRCTPVSPAACCSHELHIGLRGRMEITHVEKHFWGFRKSKTDWLWDHTLIPKDNFHP